MGLGPLLVVSGQWRNSPALVLTNGWWAFSDLLPTAGVPRWWAETQGLEGLLEGWNANGQRSDSPLYTDQCTMRLSIELENFQILKSKGLVFAQF